MAMSEQLQPAMVLMGHSPVDSKATLVTSWRGKALGRLFPEGSWLLLCFLLWAAALFLLYLAWCGYYMKRCHCIQYIVIVSWENSTFHWAIYLQIIIKMIY